MDTILGNETETKLKIGIIYSIKRGDLMSALSKILLQDKRLIKHIESKGLTMASFLTEKASATSFLAF